MNIPEQLDIMVSTRCNAGCKTCVQEVTFKPLACSDSDFFSALKKALDFFIQNGGKKIVVTGGEPLLSLDRTLKVLDILASYENFHMKAVYTNGVLLDSSVVARLKQSGVTDIGLSVHHYDNELNSRLFGCEKEWRTTDRTKLLRDAGIRFRFNLLLQKSGVHSFDEILQYLDYAFSLGANDVYIREITRYAFSSKMFSYDQDARIYCDSNRVPIQQIVDQFKASPLFRFIDFKNERYREKGEAEFQRITDGKRVFLSSLTVGSELKDSCPYLVLMPNGKLYTGWLGERDELRI